MKNKHAVKDRELSVKDTKKIAKEFGLTRRGARGFMKGRMLKNQKQGYTTDEFFNDVQDAVLNDYATKKQGRRVLKMGGLSKRYVKKLRDISSHKKEHEAADKAETNVSEIKPAVKTSLEEKILKKDDLRKTDQEKKIIDEHAKNLSSAGVEDKYEKNEVPEEENNIYGKFLNKFKYKK